MAQNLALTKGLLVSEAVMMALAPIIGRIEAHHLLADAVQQTIDENSDLESVLLATPAVVEHLGAAKIRQLTNPANYTGLAGEMVDRVLNSAKD